MKYFPHKKFLWPSEGGKEDEEVKKFIGKQRKNNHDEI